MEHDFDFGLTRIGALFHQDWGHDASEPRGLVAWWANGTEGVALQQLVVEDVQRLLQSALTGEQIDRLWRLAAEYYPANSVRGRAWLQEVRAAILPVLVHRGVTPLELEPCVHRGLLFKVNECIDALAERPTWKNQDLNLDESKQVLRDCAESVCPEIAFRFLLKAHIVFDGDISAGGYAQLESLGRRFGYGEYVVSDVEHLVE